MMIKRQDRIEDYKNADAILDHLVEVTNALSNQTGLHQNRVNLFDSQLDQEVADAYLKACQDCRVIFERLKPISDKLEKDRGPVGFWSWLLRRRKTPAQPILAPVTMAISLTATAES